jgi:hypothetical protein
MHALVVVIALIVALVVYFIPTMVARSRGHINATAIFVANLLLAWTGIGWAITLTWAFTNTTASATPLPAAPQKSGIGVPLKILLTVVIALFLLITLVGVFGRHAPPGEQSSYSKAPAVQSGVPAPADEILGK